MFKLTSLNLNGIRSATSKGVESWMAATRPDCICVQEVKAQAADMANRFESPGRPAGATSTSPRKRAIQAWGCTPGTSPSDVVIGYGSGEFDAEGRYVELRFDTPARKLSIISAYFPSGSSGEDRQLAKFRFLAEFHPHLMRLKAEREFILCGDINIAHQQIDLKNWRSNQKNSGFLPEERAWMTKLLHTTDEGGGIIDVYRQLQPTATDTAYTRGGATAAKPMPTTWVGGWTTTSPPLRWRRWHAPNPSTRARSSQTTHPSLWTTSSTYDPPLLTR